KFPARRTDAASKVAFDPMEGRSGSRCRIVFVSEQLSPSTRERVPFSKRPSSGDLVNCPLSHCPIYTRFSLDFASWPAYNLPPLWAGSRLRFVNGHSDEEGRTTRVGPSHLSDYVAAPGVEPWRAMTLDGRRIGGAGPGPSSARRWLSCWLESSVTWPTRS